MFPDFEVQDDGSDAFTRKMAGIYDLLAAKVDEANGMLADGVRSKLSGEVLQVRSGKLLGTVETIAAAIENDILTGYVTVGGPDAPYATVQEYGGRDYYEIAPVNKQALAFPGNPELGLTSKAQLADMVIVKRVNHPPLAERSFARSTVDEMRDEIVAMLEGAGGRNATVEVL